MLVENHKPYKEISAFWKWAGKINPLKPLLWIVTNTMDKQFENNEW